MRRLKPRRPRAYLELYLTGNRVFDLSMLLAPNLETVEVSASPRAPPLVGLIWKPRGTITLAFKFLEEARELATKSRIRYPHWARTFHELLRTAAPPLEDECF